MDENNTKISVSMNGKDYIKWEKDKRKRRQEGTKNMFSFFKEHISLIVITTILVIIAVILTNILVPEQKESEENKVYSEVKAEMYENLGYVTWEHIGKLTVLRFGGAFAFLIILSWLIHGVGFTIIRR